ncbi:Isochorismatase-like protein [Plectosphaerella cucumerina]|uniref:Isochorismatase-like protein n=1 Tax=Plectosphaerella cucumerina TaxID=40658 RepID=A0A8K0T4S7_9PEZI|nr:Isochorismatase-like protein [Plectosphaerella cucumerina]
MKTSVLLAGAFSALLSTAAAAGKHDTFKYERLEKNDTVVLIVDIQEGLINIARDWDASLYRNNYMAHSSLAKVFDLPVILTTSAETGPNGPLPHEITSLYPDAPIIKRNGEVDAWDNEFFRKAVRDTGKSQVILAGITTDVCTAFLAQSLRAEGYSVWANLEASGTTTELIRDAANDQMRAAGVTVTSTFAIAMDLMRDWRKTPGAAEVLPWLDQYYPVYGNVARAHKAAINNGTIIPGQDVLPTK